MARLQLNVKVSALTWYVLVYIKEGKMKTQTPYLILAFAVLY